MARWNDYDLDNPSTWHRLEAPSVDRFFVEELTRIGGRNPFGRPVLQWVWGATHVDPMAEDGGLKYWLANQEPRLRGFEFLDPVTQLTLFVDKLDEVPAGAVPVAKYDEPEQLGQRRIIIEIWRSPEFLAQSGRYQAGHLVDTDGTPLLRQAANEGAYDCFLILENEEGEPLDADDLALKHVEHYWHQHLTRTDEDKLRDTLAETAGQDDRKLAATNPSNPFLAPTSG